MYFPINFSASTYLAIANIRKPPTNSTYLTCGASCFNKGDYTTKTGIVMCFTIPGIVQDNITSAVEFCVIGK